MDEKIPVYLEIGTKKMFACAVDWPGWARAGKTEAQAVEALLAAAPRYARVVESVGIAFPRPASTADLVIVERLPGSATTDFGAPAAVPSVDEAALEGDDLLRLQAILRACWLAFEQAAARAKAAEEAGRPLRKGPRGGGRDVEGIATHVINAAASYLSSAGGRPARDPNAALAEQLRQVREASEVVMAASARGEIPERGPRGGKRWPARNLARWMAWHILDHLWEIEDRAAPAG